MTVRRRPNISLIVMCGLGLLWCWFLAVTFQGDEPGEPFDRGGSAAMAVQFVAIAALLVFLWWRRVRWWVIVTTPVFVQVMIFVVGGLILSTGKFETTSTDTATFVDGFVPAVLGIVISTAATGLAAWRLTDRD